MARVTIADVCPKCNSVGELQKGICQACGTNTLWYSNLYFKSYKNATIQHSNIIVSQVFKESEHKQKEKHLKDVERAASDFYQNAHQTLRVASLHEARSFLQHAMHATIDGESMKALITIARSIGELGDALHKYFIAGGKLGAHSTVGQETTLEAGQRSNENYR